MKPLGFLFSPLLLFLTAASARAVTLSTLYSFSSGSDGANPHAGLVQALNGNYYGTTAYGSGITYWGTIFQMTPDGTLTTLYTFSGGADGEFPQADLIQGSDGALYGSAAGGASGQGTVFRVATNGAFTSLISFTGTNGPYLGTSANALAQGNDGNLYGTTYGGGTHGYGTVFRLTTNGVLTTLASFNGTNGSWPSAGLIQSTNGFLYGTTYYGGPDYDGTDYAGWGTVYRIATNGGLTTLYRFRRINGAAPNGANPYARLVKGQDGNLYGTTYSGGSMADNGTVFRMSPLGALTTVALFGYTNGAAPWGNFVQAKDNNFFGTTAAGGTSGFNGVAFQVAPDGTVNRLALFSSALGGPLGANPNGLIQGVDGAFYGTTEYGGAHGDGTVFRIVIPPAPVLQNPTLTATNVLLTWTATAGQTYQLQYSTTLAAAIWSSLGSPTNATTGPITASDGLAPDSQRFYRVVLLP